jgi:hypothetical protein
LATVSRVRFTKHAVEKLEMVKHYGFEISKGQVIETVLNPRRLDRRDEQYFAIKILDSRYALRVVYEKRKDYLVVITFYPVRRERYGI